LAFKNAFFFFSRWIIFLRITHLIINERMDHKFINICSIVRTMHKTQPQKIHKAPIQRVILQVFWKHSNCFIETVFAIVFMKIQIFMNTIANTVSIKQLECFQNTWRMTLCMGALWIFWGCVLCIVRTIEQMLMNLWSIRSFMMRWVILRKIIHREKKKKAFLKAKQNYS
jgi:hypothetical protein